VNIPIFLSYPKPYLKRQATFIKYIRKYLNDRGIEARTLEVTDYDTDEPLTAIRRLMLESNGMITIAFRRALIKKGVGKPESDVKNEKEYKLNNQWLTSPYCHIEPAMAFQIGLPILIFREAGVIDDGMLEKGVSGIYLPEFDLDKNIEEYFDSEEWKQLIRKWECFIRTVYLSKGRPPELY